MNTGNVFFIGFGSALLLLGLVMTLGIQPNTEAIFLATIIAYLIAAIYRKPEK